MHKAVSYEAAFDGLDYESGELPEEALPQEGFEFDLLSDFWPHGDVARAYGVLDEENGLALRGSFLLDADGIVRWSVVNPRGQRRDLDGYRRALEQL